MSQVCSQHEVLQDLQQNRPSSTSSRPVQRRLPQPPPHSQADSQQAGSQHEVQRSFRGNNGRMQFDLVQAGSQQAGSGAQLWQDSQAAWPQALVPHDRQANRPFRPPNRSHFDRQHESQVDSQADSQHDGSGEQQFAAGSQQAT